MANLLPFQSDNDRVVITGIGLITAIGNSREATWRAAQSGTCGIGWVHDVPDIEDGRMPAAMVSSDLYAEGELKNIPLALHAAKEALEDASLQLDKINKERFGTFIGTHIGDISNREVSAMAARKESGHPMWYDQWLPQTAAVAVRQKFGLNGPSVSYSTACATGTIELLGAVRAIRDSQCDIAISGAAEVLHSVLVAGFENMRALARNDNPQEACRPFDANRNGFVMGEGAAMIVLESLSHARKRGATIYAEVLGGGVTADAHHLTGVGADSEALHYLISSTLKKSNLAPSDIEYINAHGTGTLQNDLAETRGIRSAFGSAANSVYVSSVKPMIGHLVNASGSVELGIMALALRDGFTPPTINLTVPDPECDLDYVPLIGRQRPVEHALKLSLAFGGHMAAVAMRRWDKLGEARTALPLNDAA